MLPSQQYLPITPQEMKRLGWDRPDFVYLSGDAYVDHPSFGVAIISRVLEYHGYRVAILPQPDWKHPESFLQFGKPRLGFLVTAGNIDSMVAHYTVAKKPRSSDYFTPGGKTGRRPDRPTIVYSQIAKSLCPELPVILGGLEASLRRFAHYDYWDNKVRPSILLDSGADLLIYGMGERQIVAIADRLNAGEPVSAITDLRGTCFLGDAAQIPKGAVSCASYEKVRENKLSYAKATALQMDEQDYKTGAALVQKHGTRLLIQNPPMEPLTTQELDLVFSLPYQRYYHPSYEKEGGVPAIQEVEFSISHNRGCFGNCNFCSIAFHQGRYITCRSPQSLMEEAEKLVHHPHFKGYIHDVGGPTANFRIPSCQKQERVGMCRRKKCLAPSPCPALQVDHQEYLSILRRLRALPGVKRVFVRSGIRYDYLMQDSDPTFLQELVQYHVSGQLKVAPEHCSAAVLDQMGKPHIEAYLRFQKAFYGATKKAGKEQYLVPYLMSSHPGSQLKDAVELALFLKKNHIRPEQVQDFYPTPGTVSTCMYYTGLHPYTLEPVFVPTSPHEKALQRALLQYFLPQNQSLVREALYKAGRWDLIGFGEDCLVRPDPADGRQKSRKGRSPQNERTHPATLKERRSLSYGKKSNPR